MYRRTHQRRRLIAALALPTIVLGACGMVPAATPTPLPPTPTATPPPTATPTLTPVPPTPTPTATATSTPTPQPTTTPTTTRPPASATTRLATPSAGAFSPTPRLATPAGNAATDVAAALDALATARSVRYAGTVDRLASGDRLRVTIETVAPDRARYVGTGSGAADNFAVVVIGSVVYVKTGDSWLKMSATQARRIAASMGAFLDVKEILNAALDATYLAAGSQAVNGEPCRVIQFTADDEQSGKLWIATRDGVPRRFDLKRRDMALSLVVVAVNETITIEPPL